MRRGRPRAVPAAPAMPDLAALEQELAQLKERQAELRRDLRERKKGSGSIRLLEEKAEKQLATAKWTVAQIRELNPDWDELAFYERVQPKAPTPRGRRKRRPEAGAAPGSEA